MFEPTRIEKQTHVAPWNALIRCTTDRRLPTPNRSQRIYSFVEVLAEVDITITLPIGHSFLGTNDTSNAMRAGDWCQYVFLGGKKWACRAKQSISGISGGYRYWELFNLVTNQADYLWGAGTQHIGTTTGISTDATQAIVQWGPTILIPVVDYTILSDRLHLVSTPSADDAARGQPLSVRV